jgi:hypothetical protein
MGANDVQSDFGVTDWLWSSMDDVIRMGASAGVSCSDCIADTLPGIASKDSMAVTVTVTVNETVTVIVTVTVTVNRLGALGPGCASCGLRLVTQMK